MLLQRRIWRQTALICAKATEDWRHHRMAVLFQQRGQEVPCGIGLPRTMHQDKRRHGRKVYQVALASCSQLAFFGRLADCGCILAPLRGLVIHNHQEAKAQDPSRSGGDGAHFTLNSPIRSPKLMVSSLHNRNHRGIRNRHHNRAMRNGLLTVLTVGMCGLALCLARAQDGARAAEYDRESRPTVSSASSTATTAKDSASRKKSAKTLSSDERLAVIASALDSKTPRFAERDCSHLVHAIYERAGFPYAYASSDDLYDGVEGFQRVSRPQTGDLVVWRGHAGIVIRPSRHVFFSFLHAGPGTDDYRSQYWTGRGEPRFYRYVKNTALARGPVSR